MLDAVITAPAAGAPCIVSRTFALSPSQAFYAPKIWNHLRARECVGLAAVCTHLGRSMRFLLPPPPSPLPSRQSRVAGRFVKLSFIYPSSDRLAIYAYRARNHPLSVPLAKRFLHSLFSRLDYKGGVSESADPRVFRRALPAGALPSDLRQLRGNARVQAGNEGLYATGKSSSFFFCFSYLFPLV